MSQSNLLAIGFKLKPKKATLQFFREILHIW